MRGGGGVRCPAFRRAEKWRRATLFEARPPLIPVLDAGGCIGHLLPTCWGWRAFDASNYELGTFPDMYAAAGALMPQNGMASLSGSSSAL